MNILVTSIYKNASGGGSGSYTKVLIDTLKEIGHEVKYSSTPGKEKEKDFDMVISSHNDKLIQIQDWKIPIVHICHGIVPIAERPIAGASVYIAISEEVSKFVKEQGFDNVYIRQPIKIPSTTTPLPDNGKILYIKNHATRSVIWEYPDMVISDPNRPIEEQIEEARMVISLGRGALEAMSHGRPVIIADNRGYIGAKGDGYLIPKYFQEVERTNFSGRQYKEEATQLWMEKQINRYNPKDGEALRDLMKKHYNSTKIAEQLVYLGKQYKNKPHIKRKDAIYGLTRVRNESAIIQDTLDHLASFCDGIFVYDDQSTDDTALICEAHPKVIKVIKGATWEKDREKAEQQNRQDLLKEAKKYAGVNDWFVYIDADERIDFNNILYQFHEVDAIRMKLFDFYITEKDKNLHYTKRKYIGPEYRSILIAFRKRVAEGYTAPDQRECTLKIGTRLASMGYVKHYGKAISIQQWKDTCDYYSKYFPKYAKKWQARKGKAVHSKSDFGADLITWQERATKGYPMKQ